MFTPTLQDHKMRQEELTREAQNYRLIRSSSGAKAQPGRISRAIQALITHILLP